MRHLLATLLLCAAAAQTLTAQGAPPQGAADQPYTMEYYYKVQWGRQQEFLRLWTRHEAEQKCVGTGIGHTVDGNEQRPWIAELYTGPGTAAAVASSDEPAALHRWAWPA